MTEAFDKLFAVVLRNQFGGRVRWSKEHHDWLPERFPGYAAGWAKEPDDESEKWRAGPFPEHLEKAVEIAMTVTGKQWHCGTCDCDYPVMHYVCDDADTQPKLYCIQVPPLDVVASHGGGGRKKHVGGPGGCAAVKLDLERNFDIGPLAVYVYGQPLPAMEVIERDWCGRCTGGAFNGGGFVGDEERLAQYAAREIVDTLNSHYPPQDKPRRF